ncbi:MAG: VWA domain-containing protein [Bacteroidetes bacterium]|jgi:Ca-activated chloride channel homolog|nr:VWA domain-containing protein [Bacteroidota bacterium]MBT6687673.1 VWA domain-containing protein [Bacteroidota bacterium]MBT7142493.1 VWA domain-containing protein [Bacteroidota bacterium]MBT7493345.1 VWA domain-containing protein [Bacteroidota bacterium]
MFSKFTYANPEFLYILLLLIPMIVWYLLKQKSANASLQVSTIKPFAKAPLSYKHILKHLMFVLRILAFSLLVLVLARPQSTDNWENVTTEGIDIVLAIDISGSMLAEDFKPNRLEAAKDVAIEFISGRENDRMGLVIYSGESFTQCPLTTDHAVLINLFKDVKNGMIEDGTAIGLGLANAINRLKNSLAKSRVVILLTDGVNNQGEIAPITAAEIAQTLGIRVYTVGVGTRGTAPYPAKDFFGNTVYQNVEVEIDEKTLKDIADLTDGQYFRATNNKSLANIYKEIDKLEKSKIEVKEYSKKQEEYLIWALYAAAILFFEIFIRNTILKYLP